MDLELLLLIAVYPDSIHPYFIHPCFLCIYTSLLARKSGSSFATETPSLITVIHFSISNVLRVASTHQYHASRRKFNPCPPLQVKEGY
jgi:hypothetical protein